MKGVDTAAHKNYIAALVRKIKSPQERIEIGTGRTKRIVEIDEADEGMKYARAAIDYEEVRGGDALSLLNAADGDQPRDVLENAVEPSAIHALDVAEEKDEEHMDAAYMANNGLEFMASDDA